MTGLPAVDPELAVALWDAVLTGLWTIVDLADSDGRRFVLARRNDGTSQGGLTAREREIVHLTARGFSGKYVAYELGLAQSTVSESLRAALAKLGLRTRYELAAVFAPPAVGK